MKEEVLKPEQILGASMLCAPFIRYNDLNRLQMVNNHVRQALPVVKSDIPIIRTGYESVIAEYAISFFNRNVKLEKLSNIIYKTNDKLNIYMPYMKYEDNILYDPYVIELLPSFVYNKKYPELKFGVNTLVAYMNYYGYVYQDGVVISESLSKKLSSLHLKTYVVKLPALFNLEKINETDYLPELLQEYDTLINYNYIDSYVQKNYKLTVPKGRVVDIQIYLYKNTEIKNSILVNYLNKYYKPELQDAIHYIGSSEVYPTKQYPIIIRFAVLYVKPAVVGDKISNRHGNKGVINLIVPDEEMPKNNKGQNIELIYSTLSIPSRMNVGQLMELLLTKIVKKIEFLYKYLYKTDKQKATKFLISFLKAIDKRLVMQHMYDMIEKKQDEIYQIIDKYGLSIVQAPFKDLSPKEIIEHAKKYEVKEKESLQLDGYTINNIGVGYEYIMKLEHVAESKLTGVNIEHTNIQSQGQRIGEMEAWNFLAHDALDTLERLYKYNADNFADATNHYLEFLGLDKIEDLPSYNLFSIYNDVLNLPINLI